MNMLPRLKPRKFYDLVIEVAIVRPGPIQGDMVHPYLKRRAGKEPVTFPCPDPEHGEPDELEKILGRTLGVPIFQEQAMKIALDAAKFSSEEANQLRKAMATFRSRGNIEVLQDKMVGRMVERGYDPDFAQRCFDQIKGFGEYGFPESHAASFAHPSTYRAGSSGNIRPPSPVGCSIHSRWASTLPRRSSATRRSMAWKYARST
jgi:error-prone DNA polymerase